MKMSLKRPEVYENLKAQALILMLFTCQKFILANFFSRFFEIFL